MEKDYSARYLDSSLSTPTKTRSAPRCTKCNGRPLRSKCHHTNQGRKYLKDQGGGGNLAEHFEDDHCGDESIKDIRRTPRICYLCPNLPLRSQCKHTEIGRHMISARAAKHVVDTVEKISQVNTSRLYLGSDSRTSSTISQFQDSWAPVEAGNPSRMARNFTQDRSMLGKDMAYSIYPETPTRLPAQHLSSIIPFSLPGLNRDAPETPEPLLGLMLAGQRPVNNVLACSTAVTPPAPVIDAVENDSTPLSVPLISFQTPKKPVARQNNPLYGHVTGAKRGNTPYSVYRTKKLPSPVENSRKASQRFSRLVNKLLEKCESLSSETGAWVFLGAQHTSARAGAISYASPRLCRDAQESTGLLATEFNGIVSNLLRARRADAVELQRRLDLVESKNQESERKRRIDESIINAYRDRFGEIGDLEKA